MSKRIFAVRNDENLSVYIDGKQFTREIEDAEEMKEVLALTKKAKEGNENALSDLLAVLDPMYKIESISSNGVFKIIRNRQGDVFLEGTNVSMPKLLVDAIVKCVEDDMSFEHLINFWTLCLQNPDPRAREDLFKFLSTYNFPITDYGYFIGYKVVYFKGEKNRYLLENLSRILINKKIARKDFSKLLIYHSQKGQYVFDFETDSKKKALEMLTSYFTDYYRTLATNHYYGSLDEEEKENYNIEDVPEELFEEYQEKAEELIASFEFYCKGEEIQEKISELLENDEADAFTDCHTRTMDIRIGKPVAMPREECDASPERTCSAGLHIGAPGYLRGFGVGGTRAIVACLVNPADVVAVPYDYEYMKMRTAKYYPYAVCEMTNDGGVVEIETKYFEEDYRDFEIEDLKKTLEAYEADYKGLENITKEEALKLIENRLQTIS